MKWNGAARTATFGVLDWLRDGRAQVTHRQSISLLRST
jgi:hypothetical protein